MTGQFLIVCSESLSEEASRWLAARSRVRDVSHDAPGFAGALRDADAIVVRTYTRIDESRLDGAPGLRVVGRAGTGLDNIDVAACRRRGIEVVYRPEANTQAVVEYVIALMLDAVRGRLPLTAALDATEWSHVRATTVGRQLSDLRIGVLGLGRIGRRVATVSRTIGLDVQYHDIREIPTAERGGAAVVDAETLFAECDIITIHVDGRPGNRGFVGPDLLSRMKDNVVLINTSRGFVVDNAALRAFLLEHPLAQAHLDVHDPEPFDARYPLLDVAGATLYPHLASRTDGAMAEMSWVVRDVMRVLDGQRPEFPAPLIE